MPERNIYHDAVVTALIRDGWKITDDPLHLSYGGRNAYVDLGAEQPLGAEKDGQKIAVEIKSFVGESDMQELGECIGKHNLYRNILAEIEPERTLYLAIAKHIYDGIFSEPVGQLMIKREKLQIIVFDDKQERIKQWIP
jgi:hypothetical protein